MRWWPVVLVVVALAVLTLALFGPREPRDVGVYTPPVVTVPDR